MVGMPTRKENSVAATRPVPRAMANMMVDPEAGRPREGGGDELSERDRDDDEPGDFGDPPGVP